MVYLKRIKRGLNSNLCQIFISKRDVIVGTLSANTFTQHGLQYSLKSIFNFPEKYVNANYKSTLTMNCTKVLNKIASASAAPFNLLMFFFAC